MYVDIPQTRELFTHYLAEINYMDQEFGNVLSILDKEKMTDKSVVVYLSEQGYKQTERFAFRLAIGNKFLDCFKIQVPTFQRRYIKVERKY